MNEMKLMSVKSTNCQKSSSKPAYQTPKLVVIGTAVELVQGGLLGEALDNLRGGRVRVR